MDDPATSRQHVPGTSLLVILLGMLSLLLLGKHAPPTDMEHVLSMGPPSEDTKQTNESQKNMHRTNVSIFIKSCARHLFIIANKPILTRLKAVCIIPLTGAL